MDGAAAECAAFAETVVLRSHFEDMRDSRRRGKIADAPGEKWRLRLLAVPASAACAPATHPPVSPPPPSTWPSTCLEGQPASLLTG